MAKYNFDPLSRFGFDREQVTPEEKSLIGAVQGIADHVASLDDDVAQLRVDYDVKVLEATHSYGVIFNLNLSTTDLQRVGNMGLHRTLPVQSGIKRCVLANNGTVVYYLKPDNSAYADLGSLGEGVFATLDGSAGQVMVEVPAHWRKFTVHSSLKFESRISTVGIPGYHFVPKFYISAFEAALDRINLRMSSVINTTAQFRGGNNNTAWDAGANSLLGMPFSNLNMANERLYARNRGTGWESMPYENYKTLWHLYHIEYANTNSQLAVSAPDAATGFRTGGLGNGVTTASGAEWDVFNGYNPFIPCGATLSLGNNSGEVSFIKTNFGGAGVNRTFTVPSYRGIENPFGHIWKRAQGIYIDVKAPADGGTSRMFVQPNPALWNDTSMAAHIDRGLIARNNGYIRNMLFGNNGDIMPVNTVGGGSTTFFTDNHEANPNATAIRCVLFSAHAHNSGAAGWSFSNTHYSPAHAYPTFGGRLCFLP